MTDCLPDQKQICSRPQGGIWDDQKCIHARVCHHVAVYTALCRSTPQRLDHVSALDMADRCFDRTVAVFRLACCDAARKLIEHLTGVITVIVGMRTHDSMKGEERLLPAFCEATTQWGSQICDSLENQHACEVRKRLLKLVPLYRQKLSAPLLKLAASPCRDRPRCS